MHYPWSFPEAKDRFLERNFADFLRPVAPTEEALATAREAMDRMRNAARAFGVTPETRAAIRISDGWMAAHDGAEEGTVLQRGLGMCCFEFRGHTIQGLAQPYRVFLLQPLQDACAAMSTADRRSIEDLIDELGLAPLLELRTRRRVEPANHREVLGAPPS